LLTKKLSSGEEIPYAMEFSRTQCLCVFNVLEIQLSSLYSGPPGASPSPWEYLIGPGVGKYSIADIGAWPWVKGWRFSGITEEEMGKYPNLLAWLERIGSRLAVKRGVGEKYVLEGARLPDF
jgi:glutathione S-transferase